MLQLGEYDSSSKGPGTWTLTGWHDPRESRIWNKHRYKKSFSCSSPDRIPILWGVIDPGTVAPGVNCIAWKYTHRTDKNNFRHFSSSGIHCQHLYKSLSKPSGPVSHDYLWISELVQHSLPSSKKTSFHLPASTLRRRLRREGIELQHSLKYQEKLFRLGNQSLSTLQYSKETAQGENWHQSLFCLSSKKLLIDW